MNDLNTVTISGRLGADGDLRYTQKTNTPVLKMSVACNEETTEYKTTSWVDVVMYGTYAEKITERAKKGAFLFVHGKLVTKAWADKDGRWHKDVYVEPKWVKFSETFKKDHEQEKAALTDSDVGEADLFV